MNYVNLKITASPDLHGRRLANDYDVIQKCEDQMVNPEADHAGSQPT
jgi:hypothetical protein